jgi:voltage-gated potassium channel
VLRKLRIIALLLMVSGLGTTWLFYMYEHPVNPHIRSYPDALWWWFVSSTTVGYGDISPVTGMGRIIGVITILVGIYSYTNFITIVADHLHSMTNQEQLGTAQCEAQDHIVICEYTAFADELIQVLPRYPELASRPVVIVTDLVQAQPYPQHHFVRGVPISPAALALANISHAAIVFVFANIRFVDPDLKTLHTVSRIRRLNPTAKIFIELGDPASPLVKHLGGDVTVLPSSELLESVLKDQAVDLSRHFARA